MQRWRLGRSRGGIWQGEGGVGAAVRWAKNGVQPMQQLAGRVVCGLGQVNGLAQLERKKVWIFYLVFSKRT
jgi:hypothetical protein